MKSTLFGLPLLLWLTLPVSAADATPATAMDPAADAAVDSRDEMAVPARTPRRSGAGGFRPSFKAGVDGVLLEVGDFRQAPEAQAAATLRASPYALWQPSREWEFRAGLRLDGTRQQGGAQPFTRWQGELGDTYARWRSGDTRITAGAQTIVWGRVDDVSIIDRVSRVDLRRFVLDDLTERRLPQWALRWEQTLGDYKVDAVLLPALLGARLPDERSTWSLINRQTGEVIGTAPSAALAALAKAAPLRQDDGGTGGGAVRLTRTGVAPFDFGVTLARTRQTLPYLQLDPFAPSFTATQPYTNFAAVDVEFATGAYTWRSELGITSGQPLTSLAGQRLRTRALDWVGGVEFFPGGDNTRVTLQLTARKIRVDERVQELTEYYSVNGEIETTLDQGRWRLAASFLSGLNVRDVYWSPKLSYIGWEPHEIYLVARGFSGESRTLGGFHREHDMLAVGLKTKF